ncbi:enoyl-CoA hydratase/isomerase family protein [Rhodococcus sp. T2V]|uniref:enoyl-CoA hydratase/isomerase family protein n=1 Tax=Rhodococcus sp. T2V TaxID=3034164 RepID=UPI0023E09077|nr:enoyl-CoA hydratase/isomerase family protein [Rhodococcus sp. T2V]MDF3310055.1 enoyl-CoA hydratase/isomerase family protein [Rhodococcus sp. T2V]
MSQAVVVERQGAVAWIRLEAAHGNALTPELVADIGSAFDAAEADTSVAAIALTSGARNFCTGAELSLLGRVAVDPLDDDNFADLGAIYELFCRMQDATLPTVAGVSGKILGAGINLALACDVRIVADDLLVRGFGATGVHPGGGHLRLLTRALGAQQAAALAMFGVTYDAPAAVEAGFALRAVPRAELDEATLALAAGVGDDAALARRVTASLRASRGDVVTPRAAVAIERAAQIWSLGRRTY